MLPLLVISLSIGSLGLAQASETTNSPPDHGPAPDASLEDRSATTIPERVVCINCIWNDGPTPKSSTYWPLKYYVECDPKVIRATAFPGESSGPGMRATYKLQAVGEGSTPVTFIREDTGRRITLYNVTVLHHVKRFQARYKLTEPRGYASTPWLTELKSFWVVRGGKYVNKVQLQARMQPASSAGFVDCRHWFLYGNQFGIADVDEGDNYERNSAPTLLLLKPGTVKVACVCHWEPFPSPTITVHAIQVESVKWRRHHSPLTPNPGSGLPTDPGVGMRVFPERRSPGGNAEKSRKVWVEAKIVPPIQGVKLHFKAFDVDDPSWNAGECDNDRQGNDNRDPENPRGKPAWTTAYTNRDGVAKYLMTLPQQPGDNLVVACSTTSESIKAIRRGVGHEIKDGRGKILNRANGEPRPSPVAAVTRPLTIWRTVHIEMDHMEPVLDNYMRRKVTAVQPLSPTRAMVTVNKSLLEPDGGPYRGRPGRFENGRMESFWGGPLREWEVETNGGKTLIVTHDAGTGPEVGIYVNIYDDDVLQEMASVPFPDPSRIHRELRRAYIEPGLGSVVGTAPFAANYDIPNDSAAKIASYYRFDARRHRARDYWVVYLLGAFQGDYAKDNDPSTESGTYGIVDDIKGLGASTFAELHYDVHSNPDARKRELADSTVHELAHLFGGKHGDGGCIDKAHAHWSAKTIAAARSTLLP